MRLHERTRKILLAQNAYYAGEITHEELATMCAEIMNVPVEYEPEDERAGEPYGFERDQMESGYRG